MLWSRQGVLWKRSTAARRQTNSTRALCFERGLMNITACPVCRTLWITTPRHISWQAAAWDPIPPPPPFPDGPSRPRSAKSYFISARERRGAPRHWFVPRLAPIVTQAEHYRIRPKNVEAPSPWERDSNGFVNFGGWFGAGPYYSSSRPKHFLWISLLTSILLTATVVSQLYVSQLSLSFVRPFGIVSSTILYMALYGRLLSLERPSHLSVPRPNFWVPTWTYNRDFAVQKSTVFVRKKIEKLGSREPSKFSYNM